MQHRSNWRPARWTPLHHTSDRTVRAFVWRAGLLLGVAWIALLVWALATSIAHAAEPAEKDRPCLRIASEFAKVAKMRDAGLTKGDAEKFLPPEFVEWIYIGGENGLSPGEAYLMGATYCRGFGDGYAARAQEKQR